MAEAELCDLSSRLEDETIGAVYVGLDGACSSLTCMVTFVVVVG